MFAWSILLQNGTSVFPGSFYIDVIGTTHHGYDFVCSVCEDDNAIKRFLALYCRADVFKSATRQSVGVKTVSGGDVNVTETGVPGHQYRARDKRTEGNRDCRVGRHQQRARYLPSWIGTRTTLLASHRNHMISLVLAFVGPPMAVLGHGEVTRSEWALLSDSATQSTSALALPLWKSRASGAQRAATAPTSAGAMW